MPDIRDIVGQTSALEKIPSIDQRNQEIKAEKQAIVQTSENAVKRESVAETKETEDKTIRKEREGEKGAQHRHKKRAKKVKKEEEIKEPKELKSSDVLEVEEGKIIDVKA
jgi:hypothetical protein